MGKPGKEYNLTAAEIKRHIKGSGGVITEVAKSIGCCWETARKLVNKYESTRRAFDVEWQEISDRVEKSIVKKIDEGSESMMKFYATTKMRDRGWAIKQSVEELVDGKIEVNFNDK